MKIPENKITYKLSDAQSLLKWAEAFSIERRKVKQSNILSLYAKLPANENKDATQDADALEKAINHVIRCNDSLRLRMVRTLRGMRQYIADYEYMPIERITVDGDEGFEAFVRELSKQELGWYDGSLLWARILYVSPERCTLIIRFHHSIIDGYSVKLFFEQMQQAYRLYKAGEEPQMPAKLYSITGFFEGRDKYLKSEAHKEDRSFWLRAYNRQRNYSFPAGYRSELGDCDMASVTIDAPLHGRIRELAAESSCSIQSAYMTVVAVTTYVLTGKDNFALYSLTHGRRTLAEKRTIGCMMNTVPIFYDIDVNQPISEMLGTAYLNYLDTVSHGRLAMGEQVPLSYKEPIKHGFNFNHGWLLFSSMEYKGALSGDEMEIDFIPQTNIPHQFYLAMLEMKDSVVFELSYQVRKFKKDKIAKICDTFARVCACIAEDPSLSAAELRAKINTEKTKS